MEFLMMAPTSGSVTRRGLYAKHKRLVSSTPQYSISVLAGCKLRGATHITGRDGGGRLLGDVLWLERLL